MGEFLEKLMDSMKELERQSERLLAELVDLRRQNRLLKGRVKRLEKATEASETSPLEEPERAELSRRVKRLIARLEQLEEE